MVFREHPLDSRHVPARSRECPVLRRSPRRPSSGDDEPGRQDPPPAESLDSTIEWLRSYQAGGFDEIKGWVDPTIFPFLEAVARSQADLDARGGVVEIGVHHGRFFIALNGLIDDGATSVAIDVFGRQELNIDQSGKGNRRRFEENLTAHDRYEGANVRVLEADSTRLRPGDIESLLTSPARLVSVDGGHTVEHTLSDMRLAAEIVAEHGLVILDDILNPAWLGVVEGAVRYLESHPTLWPVAIGHNKLVLAPMSFHGRYLELLARHHPVKANGSLCGYDLFVV